jgi:hypothetical protein
VEQGWHVRCSGPSRATRRDANKEGEEVMLERGKRYSVFSIRTARGGKATIWVRAGYAFINRDDSMNIYLDVLPLDGHLHVREAGDKRAVPGAQTEAGASDDNNQAAIAAEPMGGH